MRNFFVEDNGFEVKMQSDLQRKIKVIQFLSNEKRWYTFEEISNAIEATDKTIRKDLNYIKDVIPENWSIEIKKGYGVQLIMPIHASVNEVITLFFRKSLTFQILNKLIENNETTVVNIAEELFVQPYVVSKALKKIERDLAHFGLKLERKPIKIVGDNWRVIHMFTKLYSKAYMSTDWPFSFAKDDIFDFIERVENSMDIVLYISSRRKFAYFLAILLLRKQQGHELQWINEFSNHNWDTPQYNEISLHIDQVERDHNIAFSDAEKISITIVFKSLDYIYKYPDKERKNEVSLFYESSLPVYNITRDFISMLDNKFGNYFIKDEEFIYSIILYFRKKVHILNLLSYIPGNKKNTTSSMKKQHFKTFLKVKDVYIDWVRKHKITNHVPDEEIINIVMYIEASRISNEFRPKKTLIISGEGRGWKKYISAKLKNQFGNKIEFPPLISTNLAEEKELEVDYDIDFIISTIPLRIKSHPVIQIQPFVTERDIDNIGKYIYE
ncbi:BglG family transcription antiterminator [Lysinibacillus xylanilyticus]|uniref:BglG family transcription antiterminator n=1 Tax=Lysinibacillus xylanilyticus TaxID=582475 RepID=UPI003D015CC8